jgi:hypothetical protein
MIDLVHEVEYRGKRYVVSNGCPFDRGSADSYYGRPAVPHYYPAGTYKGPRLESEDMSLSEIRAYYDGYAYNEERGDRKDWG